MSESKKEEKAAAVASTVKATGAESATTTTTSNASSAVVSTATVRRFRQVSLNQAKDRATCITNRGIVVFKSPSMDEELERPNVLAKSQKSAGEGGNMQLACRLDKSNIFVFVGSERRALCIWDDSEQKVIGQLEYSGPVVGARMCAGRIMVMMKTRVYISSIENELKPPDRSRTTWANDCGAGDIVCTKTGRTIAAFPGANMGQVMLLSLLNENNTASASPTSSSNSTSTTTSNKEEKEYECVFSAHHSTVKNIALSVCGEMIATSSERGTVIRLFTTDHGNMVRQYRLSYDTNNTKIHAMAFSPSGKYLVVSSSYGGGAVSVFATAKKSRTGIMKSLTGWATDYFAEDNAEDTILLDRPALGEFTCWLTADDYTFNLVAQNGQTMTFVSNCLKAKVTH